LKDHYAPCKSQDLWCIKEDGFDRDIQNIRESQFSLGNGSLGIRGTLEEKPPGAKPGTYIAGIYDRMTSQVAELVNLPNPFFFKFILKGEKFGAAAMDTLQHERVLNMKEGLLLRRSVYADIKNRRYDYQSIRFVSKHDKQLGVMQIILTPLEDEAEIELQSGIDVSVHNAGIVSEGNKRHFRIKELFYEDRAQYILLETLEKRHQVIYRSGLYYTVGAKKVFAKDDVLKVRLKRRQAAVFTKIFTITPCPEGARGLKRARKGSAAAFQRAARAPFETLLEQHRAAWRKAWDIADVAIGGTADIQKNLRFNIYHMLICAHADGGFSSIGARTLSGEGYRGHIFWDAEIFLLPFYAYVLPDAARNILMYRYHRLDQARKIARDHGFRGAMFPWESAGTGQEETPAWARDLDRKVIRIRTNDLEHHITADIAFACAHYAAVSGDSDFMNNHGAEMIWETARFWASRVVKNKEGKYEIRNVIGPDEFHENVDNNAYTNMLAKWNLLEAHKLYFDLKKNKRRRHRALCSKIDLTDSEVLGWKHIAPRLWVRVRSDGVIEQFDGFFRKRPVKIVHHDENNIPLLPRGIKVRDYHKTQLVKQADVLMLLYLLSGIYGRKTKNSNFWYYLDRTLHRSSLSAAIHCLAAIEVGALSQAYQFFNVALRADISNLHGNTAEGIHAASLGGVWQCVVCGFAGVRTQGDELCVDPFMPKTWKEIRCSIVWRKDPVVIETKNNEVRIRIVSGRKKKVKIRVFNKVRHVAVNKAYLFRRKVKDERDYYL